VLPVEARVLDNTDGGIGTIVTVASDESFGEAVRRLRIERGVSLRGLAKLAPLDVGYLSKIENGHRHGTLPVARAVDKALDANGELLTIARAEQARRIRAAVPFDPMRRRAIVQFGLTAPVMASLSDASGHAPPIGRVGVGDVARVQRAVARLHVLDQRHGGESLWQSAAVVARDGYVLLERGIYTEAVAARLMRVTGRAQICAGWLALDGGQHQIARSCFTEALALAQQANDVQVRTRALANLALQSSALGRPREALRFAEAAASGAATSGESPHLPAMPQFRVAMASALVADHHAADKAITKARHVFDRSAGATAEEWNAFLGPAELDGVEGTCLLELGHSSRAAVLLEQAVAGISDRNARNRALYRTRLARARLELRAVDGALEAANAALDDLTDEVSSWRLQTELAQVADQFSALLGVDGVAAFLTRHRALAR
jgi:transcriptional regulator with XRE-family HTH domain